MNILSKTKYAVHAQSFEGNSHSSNYIAEKKEGADRQTKYLFWLLKYYPDYNS